MEIVKRLKLPKFISLTEKCNEFMTKNIKIDLPDELVEKTIAVIDEAFDRAFQPRKIEGKDKDIKDVEDRLIDIVLPIFPNDFYHYERFNKSGVGVIVKNTKWLNFWSEVPFKNIFLERIKILNFLRDAEVMAIGDIPDTEFSEEIKDKGLIVDIFPEKLLKLRKRLASHQKKSGKTTGESKQSDNKINSIHLVTPTHHDFEYFWLVFNHDYERKHKFYLKHKQTKDAGGNGYNLWLLYKEKSVDYDASFLNYMNDKIFKIKKFEKFEKTKLVRIEKGKIFLNKEISLEGSTKEMLGGEIMKYFQ